MHSQNEQKMSLGVFSSTRPTSSHQSGHGGAGDRLENSSVELHWIHFTVVKQVMVVPQNDFKLFSRWILNKVLFDPCHLFLGTEQHQCLVSCRSPAQSVSTGFLLLHGGNGGEAEPAEPHRDQSSCLQAEHQPTVHLQTETQPLRQ